MQEQDSQVRNKLIALLLNYIHGQIFWYSRPLLTCWRYTQTICQLRYFWGDVHDGILLMQATFGQN